MLKLDNKKCLFLKKTNFLNFFFTIIHFLWKINDSFTFTCNLDSNDMQENTNLSNILIIKIYSYVRNTKLKKNSQILKMVGLTHLFCIIIVLNRLYE